MEGFTGILYESEDDFSIDEVTEFLVEQLEFDMCIQNKELPGFLLMKTGKLDLSEIKRRIGEHCNKNEIKLSNLFVFHTDSFIHETEIKCD